MPDNFEGDFYLLIEIINQDASEIFSMDSSPLITLSSNNLGTTTLMDTTVINGTFAERPSVNKSGRYVVYEKSVTVDGEIKHCSHRVAASSRQFHRKFNGALGIPD